MRRLIALCVLLMLCNACTVSKRRSFLTAPPLNRAPVQQIDVAEYEEKYGKYDAVYLEYCTIVEHSGTKQDLFGMTNWTITFLDEYKYIVFNPENDYLTSLKLSNKPDSMFIKLVSPDGATRGYSTQHLAKKKDGKGNSYWAIIFPDIVRGTVVHIGIDKTYRLGEHSRPPMDHDFPLQLRYPCLHLRVEYAYPEWWSIEVKDIAPGRVPTYENKYDEKAKKKLLTYEAENIPALEEEPYSPHWKYVGQYLQFMVTDLQMGRGTMDRVGTWSEMADDFYSRFLKKSDREKLRLNARSMPFLTRNVNSLEEFIAELTRDCETARDKLDEIVYFVQDNLELQWKDYDGNIPKILKNKKGNYTDLTAVTRTLLETAGFESDFLLVHSRNDGYFDPDYVSGDQLYIPAVRVMLEGEYFVVFPLVKETSIDHTPIQFQGQPALLIRKGNFGDFWNVPGGNRANNAVNTDLDVTIAEDGTVTVNETITYQGSLAHDFRYSLDELDTEERDNVIRSLMAYSEGDVQLATHQLINLDEYRKDLIIELQYTIDNMVTILPDEIIVQPGDLLTPSAGQPSEFDPIVRNNPIEIPYNEKYTQSTVLHYPTHWRLSEGIENLLNENLFGSFVAEFENDPGLMKVRYCVTLNRCFEPKEKYPMFLKIVGDASNVGIPTLMFTVDNL